MRLARLAESLGFESVWSVEHDFTDYTMCPDPLQFLTYMTGCTTQVKLGTMVVVLPWHDPLRFADNIQRQGIDGAIEFFMNLQVWGDPLRCRDVIIDNCRRIGTEAFVAVFSYAGMPEDEAERNIRLFADQVMPDLKAMPIRNKIDWAA